MTRSIDLNIDLGEEPEHRDRDDSLATCATSINLACGGHAGDDDSMLHFIALGRRLGAAVGAHPSYPDRRGFGREPCRLSKNELRVSLAGQIRALARLMQPDIPSHIKPHGRLYHDCSHDPVSARTLVDAACDALDLPPDRLPPFTAAAGSAALDLWASLGVRTNAEAFIDRAYLSDGSLAPRSMPQGVLADPPACARRAIDLALGRPILAIDGTPLSLAAATLCLHSDTPGALDIARSVRAALIAVGVILAPPSR